MSLSMLPCTIFRNADGATTFAGMTPEFAESLTEHATSGVLREYADLGKSLPCQTSDALRFALCDDYGMMLSCTVLPDADGFITFANMPPAFIEHLLGYALSGTDDTMQDEFRYDQYCALSNVLWDHSDLNV